METLLIFACGLPFGVLIGASLAWHVWLKSEQPQLHITLDKSAVEKLTQQQVLLWLDKRGLVWQPKGAVFDPDRKIH